ncbi:glycosyl hydrolase family 18 protein [Luteibacter anthropi]|uniref:chitinase n=1 Tax=Luteibacter anthropi TaxID=564369 RepID=A0A7X5ZI46_9GAMM|nr:glycosyl hydrolase family 18 protein [Luteibacter anthropi]NII06472.1 chitinase [Luteibacter anthropi]
MRVTFRHLILSCALPLAWLATSAHAQSATCTGVSAWNAATIYNAGDKLTYKNHLYQATSQIWNTAPDYCPSCGWYQDLGTCSGGGSNQPPTAAITAPANGATFTAGANITLTANASDSDGTVAKVEFFRGATSLGSKTSAPWSVVWSNAPAGSYVLTAIATDNAGASTTSSAVNITVSPASNDTTPPSVPSGLAGTPSSNSVSLSWSASTDNAGGSGVAGYDIYRNGALVGNSTSPSYTDTGLAASTSYTYTVRARDNAGNASAQSGSVVVKTTAGGGGGNRRVIGYFTQWGIYDRAYTVKNIETSGSAARLTHINYAFGNVRNDRCEVGVIQPSDPNTGVGGDAFADYTKSFGAGDSVSGTADTWDQPLRGNWNQLKQLKAKHPGLKVLISLGGWTWSRGFAHAARPENRQAFVASCVDAYIKGNLPVTDGAGGTGAAAGVFDGIDIDWEYPAACGLQCGGPEDTANFTALLAEFRRQLDAVRPGLLLTIAAGAGVDKIRVTQPGQYAQYLDYINVMTYDFHGAWDPTTNHHSALYATASDPSTGDTKKYNTNDAIQAFLATGVPASKLNVGIGFYGRGWTNVAKTNNGLYQSGTAAPGRYEAGIEDWKVLKALNYPGYDDAAAGAHWIYNGTTWWSVDDPANIQRKMSYVKSQSLGGAFSWDFSGDDANGTLLKAMADGLQ